MNHRARGTARHDESSHLLEHCVHRPAGLLLHELPFIVVHGDPARLRNEALQVVRLEHGQPLPGIKDERNARGGKIGRMLNHAAAAVGGDDADGDAARVRHAIDVRVLHRAGMKRRDLIVVPVGGDEGLGGVLGLDDLDVIARHAGFNHPLRIGIEVPPRGRHRKGRITEQAQVVGDVARTAAEFAPELGHEKGDIQHMDLVGQDVRGKAIGEHHDGVIGEGSADQCPPRGVSVRRVRHGCGSVPKLGRSWRCSLHSGGLLRHKRHGAACGIT